LVLSQLKPQSQRLEAFLVLSQQMLVNQLPQEQDYLELVPSQQMHQPLQEDYSVEQLSLMQISQQVV
jgi:hypothetical protein